VRRLRIRTIAALATLIAAASTTPAQAANAPSSSSCSTPSVSQVFLGWGDTNWYTLVPGESLDNFAGTGWTLSGGARLVSQKLYDGKTGYVLDMPSGSKAVSPLVCIGNGYPIAKTLIRNLAGTSDGVAFTPFDLTTNKQQGTMQLRGSTAWSLSPPVNVLPGAVSGWHIMQFTYVAGGRTSDFQIYDFAVDPHMK
jgi:hypothetical protein